MLGIVSRIRVRFVPLFSCSFVFYRVHGEAASDASELTSTASRFFVSFDAL